MDHPRLESGKFNRQARKFLKSCDLLLSNDLDVSVGTETETEIENRETLDMTGDKGRGSIDDCGMSYLGYSLQRE